MACSDNVVRAGLTPKMKDVDNLVDMLTYAWGALTSSLGWSTRARDSTLCYSPCRNSRAHTTVETGATYDMRPASAFYLDGVKVSGTQLAAGRTASSRSTSIVMNCARAKSLYYRWYGGSQISERHGHEGAFASARARQNLSLAGRAEDSQ